MYANEGETEVVQEKDWKMNTGLQVLKAAALRLWQHNDNACERALAETTCGIKIYPPVLLLTVQWGLGS